MPPQTRSRQLGLLDLPPELLVSIAHELPSKDKCSLMLACRSLRALLVEQWSAAAAPKDGHMTMVVDGSEGVARWQRFFRAGVQMPVRSLDLVLRGQLQTSYLRLHDLVLQLCKCFEASLRVLHISTGWIGDASFVCAAAGLRLLALRQLTLEMATTGYSYMSFNLDLRDIQVEWVDLRMTGTEAAYLHDLLLHPAVRRLDLYCDRKVKLNRPSRFCSLLSELPNLRELCVLSQSNLACEELRALQLTRLCLRREFGEEQDPDEDLELLDQQWAPTDLLPATLSELELCEQQWVAPASIMEHLSRLTALTRLSLANCDVLHDAATLGCLTRLARLRELDISAPASPLTLSPLSALRSLTFLHFTVTPAFTSVPRHDDLPVLKRLHELHIDRADFGTPAQEASFDALVNCLPPVRVTVLDM